MTTFTASPAVYLCQDWISPGTLIDNTVDYQVSINGGSNDYINQPNPGTSTVTLIFDDETVPEIFIGQFLAIKDTNLNIEWFRGKIVAGNTEYRNWGTDGFLVAWNFELVGVISDLQKATWYNPSIYTGTTTDCIAYIAGYAGLSTWSQVLSTLTWSNVSPTATWADYDGLSIGALMGSTGTNLQSQTLAAGWRNVWDDFVTLTYGAWGYIYENAGSQAWAHFEPTVTQTIANNQMLTSVKGVASFTNLRNDVELTKYDTTTKTYREQQSVAQYGDLPGSLTTLINNNSDLDTTGAKILNGLAYPTFGLDMIEMNLYNPNIATTDVTNWWTYLNYGKGATIEAPYLMGGTQDYLPVGYALSGSKNAWIMSFNLVPFTVAVNSINWLQVPASYTWTSYGTAYPTQKWSDL